MSSARLYQPQYTVADYNQWEGDWELWHGYPVSMSPSPFGQHQAVSTKFARFLGNAIDAVTWHATVLSEMDWILDHSTVVRPDGMVVCGGPPVEHVETPPALAFEVVSPSSVDRDRIHKRDLYRDHGVANYVIVDPIQLSITLHRQADDWREQNMADLLRLMICDCGEIEINLDNLFG